MNHCFDRQMLDLPLSQSKASTNFMQVYFNIFPLNLKLNRFNSQRDGIQTEIIANFAKFEIFKGWRQDEFIINSAVQFLEMTIGVEA